MKTALFAGTFNPFTKGHANIVERGLQLFDKVIIGIGINTTKDSNQTSAETRCREIATLYQDEPRVEVRTYNTLTVDFAQEINAQFLLRGVRNIKDFNYEREIADVNRRLSGIETILLFADTENIEISSTLVRELQAFGKDVSQFLPKK